MSERITKIKKLKKLRSQGFLKRTESASGRKTLTRRRAKGRKSLA